MPPKAQKKFDVSSDEQEHEHPVQKRSKLEFSQNFDKLMNERRGYRTNGNNTHPNANESPIYAGYGVQRLDAFGDQGGAHKVKQSDIDGNKILIPYQINENAKEPIQDLGFVPKHLNDYVPCSQTIINGVMMTFMAGGCGCFVVVSAAVIIIALVYIFLRHVIW